ncbi:MAG: TonB-dependent receptor [Pseudomonadota bacterium]
MSYPFKAIMGACAAGVALAAGGNVQAQDSSEPIDEITVTGIRAAIERGQEQKRGADQIIDAVSAEELGKFPDTNVAESLQRITGVAITRQRGGEGRFVTVRGLGQEFNQLTINGRRLATENAGREFSYDVIASELVSAAQIFKSPTASQTDGSIGGLVNIQTARPFDRMGFQSAFSIAGQYETLNESTSTQASGVISNTFADDTIGILASLSYQEREIRTDTAESIAIDASTDYNGDGVNDRLNSFNANINNEDRERIGGSLVLQWAPSDLSVVTFDALYSRFESPSLSSSYSYFPNPGLASNVTVDAANDVLSQTSNFTAGNPFSNIFDFVARRAEADTDTFQFGVNFDSQLSDRLTYQLDASYSKADGIRDNVGSNAGSGSFYVVSYPGANFTQTFNGQVPNIDFTALPTVNDTTTVGIDQLPPEGARLHFSRNSSNEISDEILTLRADFQLEMSETSSLQFGADFISRGKENKVFDNEDGGRFCGDTSVALPSLGAGANAFFCDRSLLFSDFLGASDLARLLIPFNGQGEDFLGSTGANIPRNFLTPNIAVVELAFDNLAQLTGAPSYLSPTFNATSSSDIDESILSAYVQANFTGDFGGVPFTANAGLRLAYTDVESTGAQAPLQQIVIDSVSGNNAITLGSPTSVSFSNSYLDVLPSFNIAFDLDDNLILRAGFSRSLARPTFNDLSTFFAVTQINAGQEEAASGNPSLEAVRSDNFDASLEWYGDNGLSLTGAVFYKNISDFINNGNSRRDITIPDSVDLNNNPLGPQTINFLITEPQNGDSAEVYGLELASQYLLDNGFGVSANLTLSDSDATANGQDAPLENISDLSYNIALIYENYGWQAQLSMNYRDAYLASTEGEGGFAEFFDDYTQVDLSVSYDLYEVTSLPLSIFLEGINITDEQFYIFSERDNFLESFIDNGARWQIGVRGTF